MANLYGTLFSFILILPTLLFGVDLINIAKLSMSLEKRATIVSYQISDQGGLRAPLIESLALEGINISCQYSCEYISVGETITFEMSTFYDPIIIKKEPMEISVTRMTIVGYL